MSRSQSVEIPKDQKVADWTGFHQQVSSPERKDEVSSYLLAEYWRIIVSILQEVLRKVKAKAETIDLKEEDLVLDHASYKLVLKVLMDPKNEKLKSFINLRIGGFHTSCIYISVIGKRFAARSLH